MLGDLVNASHNHSGGPLCQRTELKDIFVPILLGMAIIIGNTITLLTIRLTPSFRTTPDMYLASLATSDLLIGVTIILNIVINNSCWYMDRSGQVYKYTCLTNLCIGGASGVASVINLAMVSVDRCMAVSYPFIYRSHDVKRLTLLAILVCWISSFSYGFLILLFNRFSHLNKCLFTVQTEVWYLRYLTTCLILSGITVSAVCYIKIARVFYESDQNFQSLVMRSRKTWTLPSLSMDRKTITRRLCFINAGKNEPKLPRARIIAGQKRTGESIRPDRCDEQAHVGQRLSDRCCRSIKRTPRAETDLATTPALPRGLLRSGRSCDGHLEKKRISVEHRRNHPPSYSLVNEHRIISKRCEHLALSTYLSYSSDVLLSYNRHRLIPSRLKSTLSVKTPGQPRNLRAERFCSSQPLINLNLHGSSCGIVPVQPITQHVSTPSTEKSMPPHSQSDHLRVATKEIPCPIYKVAPYSESGTVSIATEITPPEEGNKQCELETHSLARSTSLGELQVKTFANEMNANHLARNVLCQISKGISWMVSNMSSTETNFNSPSYQKDFTLKCVSMLDVFRIGSAREKHFEQPVSLSEIAIRDNSHHDNSTKCAKKCSLIKGKNQKCEPLHINACLMRTFSERTSSRYKRKYYIPKQIHLSLPSDENGESSQLYQFKSAYGDQPSDNKPIIKSFESMSEINTIHCVNGNKQIGDKRDEMGCVEINGETCSFLENLGQHENAFKPESCENAGGSDSGISLLNNERVFESDFHPNLSRSSSSRSSFQRVLSEKKMARTALAKDLSWNSRRVLKMIFITQIIFTLCLLPTTVIFAFHGQVDIPDWLLKLSSTLTFLNSFINIFVYAGYSVKYRAAIWSVLMCRIRK